MSTETEGDKWRRFLLDLAKMGLPALLAWYTTDHFKQQEIDHGEGALDTCRGAIYEGQSPAYYEGFNEQRQVAAEEEGNE